MIPTGVSRYRLLQAHVPASLLQADTALIEAARLEGRSPLLSDEFCVVDLEICDGTVVAIAPAGQLVDAKPGQSESGNGSSSDSLMPAVDLRRKQVWPCFVDMHTHLDKGHIWERSPNPDCTFDSALEVVRKDSEHYWQADDLYRRMSFGLKCSYAHGTRAIRTHIDAYGDQAGISLEVFRQLQQEWRDRLTLQAVCLVTVDYFCTPEGEALADQMAEIEGGVLGGVAFPNENIDAQLDRVFAIAQERQLSLDFHSDESGNPHDKTLRHIARAAIRHQFDRPIVCGHCCSLAVQPPEEVQATIDVVKEAGIGIVSLPLCNLYLQDR
ncbi:MAG: cytosine deaminase, partial [Elainellaceae cyanobacterium]